MGEVEGVKGGGGLRGGGGLVGDMGGDRERGKGRGEQMVCMRTRVQDAACSIMKSRFRTRQEPVSLTVRKAGFKTTSGVV